MPRPFPTPEDLAATRPKRGGLLAWIRGWLQARKQEPEEKPAHPTRPPLPAILPEPDSDPSQSRQWLTFLKARGAPPRSTLMEELRAGLLEDILAEATQAVPGKADGVFLQKMAKMLMTADLHLPPFPAIARELDSLLFRGDPSVMEVTAVVERDPGLVREIWVRASGANFRRPPSRLDEAISRVGFTELWRVTMQMAVQSPVFRAGRYQAEAELIHAHGTMCAEVAAQIAREPRGTAYLAGLLHDVGKLVIFRAAGGLKDPPSPVLIARILQNHHSTIGMMAARSWNLGPEIEQAIGFHHHPPFTALNKPGPLGPTAMAEAALQIAAAERSQGKNDSGILDLAGEPIHSPVPVPDFVELPEELREAVLTAHRLMDARVKAESTGKKGKK